MHIDLSGRIFGELTVIHKVKITPRKNKWLCKCSCGNETKVLAGDLNGGRTKSCGHLANKIHSELRLINNISHGLSKHPLYGIWKQMLKRCEDRNDIGYKYYGERGIIVCERWHDLKNFIEDMSPRPSLNHSLDRKHNDGNYEKSNCKWATAKEQLLNRRIN